MLFRMFRTERERREKERAKKEAERDEKERERTEAEPDRTEAEREETEAERKRREQEEFEKLNPVLNFMDGISFRWNPLDTLKMVTASSIMGEPAYYRDGEFCEIKLKDGLMKINPLFAEYAVSCVKGFDGMTTTQVMEKAIDDALDYDFRGTLEWAATLRKEYYMRLNPQVIMVRAAIHPKRQEFTKEHPGLFGEIEQKVMLRADEPASQLLYYLFRKGSKQNLPSVLKRSWARRIGDMSRYEMHKYRNTGMGLIDTVRICHAKGSLVDELMKTGTVKPEEEEKTWETLRSAGANWETILDTVQMGHMALLRNLRGIFTEISDPDRTAAVLDQLRKGVPGGKQFPFRYYSAYQTLKEADKVHHKQMILDALEECIDISCENLPRLKGRTVCLSDNSGSAWGTIPSEYGSVTIAVIDNLSSVIAAYNSDEGTVGKFGDRLVRTDISKRNGILRQTEEISRMKASDVGGSTECGIWLFFDQAIKTKEVYDHIFIYSDMQAGHGGLYGTPEEMERYKAEGFGCRGNFIDVSKLISEYRRKVNPKVNVFSVQTAGYDNVVIPENGYRTALLYGWTGKELLYAKSINDLWDQKEQENR